MTFIRIILLHIFIQDLLIYFFYKSIHTIKFYATFVVIILADSVKIHRNKVHCSAPNININMYCVIFTVHILKKERLIDDIQHALLRHSRSFGSVFFIISVKHKTEILLNPFAYGIVLAIQKVTGLSYS